MSSALSSHPLRQTIDSDTTHSWIGGPLFERSPIFTLNQELDEIHVLHGVNESVIEGFLSNVEAVGDTTRLDYWLMVARIAELALLCAGSYVDNCEFSAAGDLLINPRKILVHRKGHRESLIKQRHSFLSDQLNPDGCCRQGFLLWFRREVTLETVESALLPYLLEQLEYSQRLASRYVDGLRERMKRVADTIGFLSAWCVSRVEDLHQHMRHADTEIRRFVEANLCKFDPYLFKLFGWEIRQLERNPDYRSQFLAYQEDP
jgi:hypothetical protein